VPSEVALVEDLIRAAVNSASAKVAEAMKGRMSDLARQMGVDPSMLGGIPGL
jgi:DNA-binding protein YbaB